MLIDSHCHLDRFEPGDRAALLERAAAAGLSDLLTICTRLSEADVIRSIARGQEVGTPGASPRIWCTVGTHPDEVENEAPPDPHALADLVDGSPEIVGIGETGLDFAVSATDPERQRGSFRAHLRAARLASVPLVIHTRGADDATGDLLETEFEHGGACAFVLHCFSSGRALAERAIALGGYVSFSGILTFPKAQELREIARDLPADRLLVETDAPFLAPVPRRGRINEPAYVAHTARVLAEVRGSMPEDLAELTTANFRRLFRTPS